MFYFCSSPSFMLLTSSLASDVSSLSFQMTTSSLCLCAPVSRPGVSISSSYKDTRQIESRPTLTPSLCPLSAVGRASVSEGPEFMPQRGQIIPLDFPGGSDGKASAYNVGNPGSIPGSGRSLEKEIATPSNILASHGRIPWTEEPGRLQFMGS